MHHIEHIVGAFAIMVIRVVFADAILLIVFSLFPMILYADTIIILYKIYMNAQ